MSATAVRTPTEYEERLQRYLFERSEEARAVRVGEKEVSEQAEIVARYADLFTRPQLEELHRAEGSAEGDERELHYRLRKACEGGLIAAELAAREATTGAYETMRDRWFERLLGPERAMVPTSNHTSYMRRLSPLEATYPKDRCVEVCLATLDKLGFDLEQQKGIRLDLDDRPQ